MTESIDMNLKIRLIQNLLEINRVIQNFPVKKTCSNCEHWREGCWKADGAIPPQDIQESGCEQYKERDYIPF